MNNFNSVLIEGTVVNNAKLSNIDGAFVFNFTIVSNRYFKKKGCIDKETLLIDIEAWSKHSENYYNKLTKGRNLRIVGRLKQSNNNIVIEAEHIEFKPQINIDNQCKLLFNEDDI